MALNLAKLNEPPPEILTHKHHSWNFLLKSLGVGSCFLDKISKRYTIFIFITPGNSLGGGGFFAIPPPNPLLCASMSCTNENIINFFLLDFHFFLHSNQLWKPGLSCTVSSFRLKVFTRFVWLMNVCYFVSLLRYFLCLKIGA